MFNNLPFNLCTLIVPSSSQQIESTLRTFSPYFGHPNEQIREQIKMHVPLRAPLALLSRPFERSSDATKLPDSTQKLVRFGNVHNLFINYKGELWNCSANCKSNYKPHNLKIGKYWKNLLVIFGREFLPIWIVELKQVGRNFFSVSCNFFWIFQKSWGQFWGYPGLYIAGYSIGFFFNILSLKLKKKVIYKL